MQHEVKEYRAHHTRPHHNSYSVYSLVVLLSIPSDVVGIAFVVVVLIIKAKVFLHANSRRCGGIQLCFVIPFVCIAYLDFKLNDAVRKGNHIKRVGFPTIANIIRGVASIPIRLIAGVVFMLRSVTVVCVC